jgi:hypothetical protein
MAERAFSTRASARPHPHIDDPTRARIEAAAERLIALLDELDAASEDMEEDDFGGGDVNDEGEPSLGWGVGIQITAEGYAYLQAQDLEDDDCDDEESDNGIADSGGVQEQHGYAPCVPAEVE